MRLCLHIVSFVMNAHKCNVSSHLDNAKVTSRDGISYIRFGKILTTSQHELHLNQKRVTRTPSDLRPIFTVFSLQVYLYNIDIIECYS